MIEALSAPFFQRVLLAALLASVACGVVGSYVVAKRIASISGGLAHAAFGGVGIGYLAGFPPMMGAAAFGLVAAIAVGLAQRRFQSGLDTVISMAWSLGMALGIIFIALSPGYAPDLMSYLFGSLLFIPGSYLWVVGGLDLLVLLGVLLFHRQFEAVCFDEEFAEVAGAPVEPILLGLLALTSLAVVTLIRVAGIILAIALLTTPAAAARPWVSSLRAMMALSVALSCASTLGGLFLSYVLSDRFSLSIPPGPLIVVLVSILYGVSASGKRVLGAAPSIRSEAAS
jgi:zinc transport system permease protein